MDIRTAVKNYNFLAELKPFKKLTVTKDNETSQYVLCYDNRWVQSVRRTATGDSRKNLLLIVEQTFDALHDNNPLNSEEEQKILTHVSSTLKKTYPSFVEIHGDEGVIEKLLQKSKNFEAQRKAQELLLERSMQFSNRTHVFEPNQHCNIHCNTHVQSNIPSQNSQSRPSLDKDNFTYNVSNKITSDQPISVGMHDIILDDHDIENGKKCCGCFKSKLK